MALKKTAPSLVETLTQKADELDTKADAATAAGTALALEAATQHDIAETARRHATAVDAALAILADAGVTV